MDYRDWREPDIIEGDYVVLEDRDVEEEYPQPKHQPIQTDPKPAIVTHVILGLNIAIWIVMSLTGLVKGWNQNIQLQFFGAKINGLIAMGQYWRMLTAMFLHVGLLHLFFNSYALYIYGPVVEKLFGKVKFIIIYLISGLMGNLLSYLFSPNPAAGASGAIFGLMGSLLYFRKERKRVFQKVFGPGLLIVIGINLVYGFTQQGIDNWGHIGGLIGGFAIGCALGLYKDSRKQYKRKILIWVAIILVFAAGLSYGRVKYRGIIYLNQAHIEAQSGRISEAMEYISKLSNRDLKDPWAKELIETVFIEDINNKLGSGKPREALVSASTLIDYYPKEANYYYFRGQIYEVLEDFKNALEDYLYVTGVVIDNKEIWLRAGRSAYNSGKISDAKRCLKEALKLDPGYSEARELLESIGDTI
ncbi:MAG: rhomboid family intramembrane serine protease [Clostridiales bacterium]|nr:rhomboid family intramembrane serine protease [Clostridiales bacterium]